jgi:hypothetical protein
MCSSFLYYVIWSFDVHGNSQFPRFRSSAFNRGFLHHLPYQAFGVKGIEKGRQIIACLPRREHPVCILL